MLQTTPRPTQTRSAAPVRTLGWVGLGVVGVVLFDPQHTHVPLCPFKAMTGWDCPLCGGLRSVNALAHAQVGEALRDNVLVAVGAPLAIGLLLAATLTTRRLPTARWLYPAAIVLGLAFTVVRNLPSMGWLRPG